jgi:hypothetical protein
MAHTPAWQSSALLVEASRPFLLPALATSAPHSCAQLLPPPPQAFPRSLPVPFTSPSDLVLVTHTQTSQPFTPLAHTLRDVFLITSSSPSSYIPAEPSPPPVHVFSAVLQSSFATPSHFASGTHVHTSQQPTSLSNLARHVSPPLPPTVASHLPFPIPLPPTFAFPTTSEPQVPLTLFAHPTAVQQHAPFITAPREVPLPAPSPSILPQSYQVPPPLADSFPLAPQSHLPVQPAPAAMQPVPARQQSACLSSVLRDDPPHALAILASRTQVQTPSEAMRACLPAIQRKESDRAVPTQGTSRQAAPAVRLPRGILPHPKLIQVAPAPRPHPPMPAKAFPTVPEPTGSVALVLQPNAIDVILNALADKIAALARGIEALLANQRRPESGPRQPKDAQGKAERCCFCGSAAHLDDECKEVVKYILAGKCKRNVFGKLTLPSGAEVPRSIRGRNLLQRFDKYHQQYPGQQAVPVLQSHEPYA